MIGTPHYLKVAAAAAMVSLFGCAALSAQPQDATAMPTEYDAVATAGNGGMITIAVPNTAAEYPTASEPQEAGYQMSAQPAPTPPTAGNPTAYPVNSWARLAEFSHAHN